MLYRKQLTLPKSPKRDPGMLGRKLTLPLGPLGGSGAARGGKAKRLPKTNQKSKNISPNSTMPNKRAQARKIFEQAIEIKDTESQAELIERHCDSDK